MYQVTGKTGAPGIFPAKHHTASPLSGMGINETFDRAHQGSGVFVKISGKYRSNYFTNRKH